MMVRNQTDDDRYIFGNGKGWSIEVKRVESPDMAQQKQDTPKEETLV